MRPVPAPDFSADSVVGVARVLHHNVDEHPPVAWVEQRTQLGPAGDSLLLVFGLLFLHAVLAFALTETVRETRWYRGLYPVCSSVFKTVSRPLHRSGRHAGVPRVPCIGDVAPAPDGMN